MLLDLFLIIENVARGVSRNPFLLHWVDHGHWRHAARPPRAHATTGPPLAEPPWSSRCPPAPSPSPPRSSLNFRIEASPLSLPSSPFRRRSPPLNRRRFKPPRSGPRPPFAPPRHQLPSHRRNRAGLARDRRNHPRRTSASTAARGTIPASSTLPAVADHGLVLRVSTTLFRPFPLSPSRSPAVPPPSVAAAMAEPS